MFKILFDFVPAQHFDNFFFRYRWFFIAISWGLALFLTFFPRLNRKKIEHVTIGVQATIAILLNIWYITSRYHWLKESLPLYHCRIFIWGLIICHYTKHHDKKMFFALGGLMGAVIAFLVPETDPFNFPHITIISFSFGHMFLLINSLLAFRLHYRKLTLKEIVLNLSLMSIVMASANFLFKGNYGFMTTPPKLIAPIIERYVPMYPVVLTLFLALFVWLANELIYHIHCYFKKQSNTI